MAFLCGSRNCTHRLLRLAGACRGCHFRLPFGVPWGLSLSGAPLILSANIYCFHDVSRGWEAGGWVSLPSEAPGFILYLARARNLSLPLEPDSGALKARQNPRCPEHRGAFLSPRKTPVGKGWGPSSFGNGK